jgi:DNA-directed RNA polymerase subunit beta
MSELKAKYSKELKELKANMIERIVALMEGKSSAGIKHKFGDEIFSKGVKYSKKNITECYSLKKMFIEMNLTIK